MLEKMEMLDKIIAAVNSDRTFEQVRIHCKEGIVDKYSRMILDILVNNNYLNFYLADRETESLFLSFSFYEDRRILKKLTMLRGNIFNQYLSNGILRLMYLKLNTNYIAMTNGGPKLMRDVVHEHYEGRVFLKIN